VLILNILETGNFLPPRILSTGRNCHTSEHDDSSPVLSGKCQTRSEPPEWLPPLMASMSMAARKNPCPISPPGRGPDPNLSADRPAADFGKSAPSAAAGMGAETNSSSKGGEEGYAKMRLPLLFGVILFAFLSASEAVSSASAGTAFVLSVPMEASKSLRATSSYCKLELMKSVGGCKAISALYRPTMRNGGLYGGVFTDLFGGLSWGRAVRTALATGAGSPAEGERERIREVQCPDYFT
jgi:hypothetical protein